MKMIEVDYRSYNEHNSEWKSAKTKKLCKLLKRVFGKHAVIVGCGNQGYYDVAIWNRDASNGGYVVGQVYISATLCSDVELPEDFFEEE